MNEVTEQAMIEGCKSGGVWKTLSFTGQELGDSTQNKKMRCFK